MCRVLLHYVGVVQAQRTYTNHTLPERCRVLMHEIGVVQAHRTSSNLHEPLPHRAVDSCKHLEQTCRDWGRKKNTVSSECYLSGYHPTQSYLIQPHPTLDSSTSLPCSTPANHLVSCHPTQWNHSLPGPTLEPPAILPCSPLSYPILPSPTSSNLILD